MLFRVLFTNDVDEHYKENPMDMRVSLVVEAKSFNNAMLTAQALMESLVFWPSMFEVVSVEHIEDSLKEVNIQPEPIKKAAEIWCLDTGIQIMDPDGWRYDSLAWDESITREDFLKRAYMSTVRRWPTPLWDEEEETTDIYRKRP